MSDYLPDEVVREILYRLPAKSLIRFRSPPPKSDQLSAVGLQGVVKKALPLAGDIGMVESEDERVRDKETIRKLKKAMVDQQEERVRDKETICKLKKAMVENTSSGVGDVGS
ncbi:hypothetical protein ACB092_11G202600 [Castanea dentata]